MAQSKPETISALMFGNEWEPLGNASLATSLREAATWADENPDAYIHNVAVDYADEFSTWWVTLYCDSRHPPFTPYDTAPHDAEGEQL